MNQSLSEPALGLWCGCLPSARGRTAQQAVMKALCTEATGCPGSRGHSGASLPWIARSRGATWAAWFLDESAVRGDLGWTRRGAKL